MSLKQQILDRCKKRAFSEEHFPDYTSVTTTSWTNMEEFQKVYKIHPFDCPDTEIVVHSLIPEESVVWRLAALSFEIPKEKNPFEEDLRRFAAKSISDDSYHSAAMEKLRAWSNWNANHKR